MEPVPALERLRNEALFAARRAYHSPGRRRYLSRLQSLPSPARDGVRVNFGWIGNVDREEEARIGG
ncbi:MAG: hypothetical protein ACREKL_14605, partial [Chthoniobacterales bacterium]